LSTLSPTPALTATVLIPASISVPFLEGHINAKREKGDFYLKFYFTIDKTAEHYT
jgi:hypothetical protein